MPQTKAARPLGEGVVDGPPQYGPKLLSQRKVFGVPLSESAAKSLVAGLSGAAVGRMVSQVLLGWIPGVGNAINAATAAAITETLGWKAARRFEASAA